MEFLLWVLVGLFIGWNLPQPWYAKKAQDWVLGKIKNFID